VLWAHYISGIFINSWKEAVRDSRLIPANPEELSMMLQNYLLLQNLEKLNFDINYNEEQTPASLNILLSLLKPEYQS
jgi:hypothetical protein